ncbi:MAG: hypothetical protein WCT04_24055 [Planctomycetota bacterium]
MAGHLKSMTVYGDWEDDSDYVAPFVSRGLQHQFFDTNAHPAKIMLKVFRNARGVLREDQLERQYILSIKDALASRDKHFAEGMYWHWAVNERDWRQLCDETAVSFDTLEMAADKLLDPPLHIASNTKSQWMKRILDATPPTLQHAIFTGGRDGVTVSSAYLLCRTPEQEKKLARVHSKMARPLTHGNQVLPRLDPHKDHDLEKDLLDEINAAFGVDPHFQKKVNKIGATVSNRIIDILEMIVGNLPETDALRQIVRLRDMGYKKLSSNDEGDRRDFEDRILEIMSHHI